MIRYHCIRPKGFLRVSSFLILLALLSGCSPLRATETLTVDSPGQQKQEVRWVVNDQAASGTHKVFLTLENDPAKLLLWEANGRTYDAQVKLLLTGPDGERHEAIKRLPISELQAHGESLDGRTTFLAPQAAGVRQPNGMTRTDPIWVFSFRAKPGLWTLDVTLQAPPNTDRRGLLALRSLDVVLKTRSRDGEELSGWTIEPRDEPAPLP